MSAIITEHFRILNAQAFLTEVNQGNSNFYLGVGRITPWGTFPDEDGLQADDNNPPFPSSAVQPLNTAWRDLIGAKNITGDRMILSIPRHDWTSGTVYDRYDAQDETLFRKPFYVITDDYNIYKCIDNNGASVSTVKPTGQGPSLIQTADGYVWKFMDEVATADVERFLTPQHIPVRLPPTYTEALTGGPIHTVTITDGGSGYDSNTTVTIEGDGTGATADAVVSNGEIVQIEMLTPGSNYNWAKVEISGNGNGAVAYPNIQPRGGHGHNILEELGAFYVTMNVRLEYDESGNLSVENDYRKIQVIRNPLQYGTSNPFTQQSAKQVTQIELSNVGGVFNVDEVVTGSNSGASARVVEHDTDSSPEILHLTRTRGDFNLNEAIAGQDSAATADVSSVTKPDMEPYSGKIDYLEYRKPIARSSDQIEELRITIEW